MNWVWKYNLHYLILIILLYFAFRLPNLTLQPIFADEAIYIRWAQVMRAEPSLRFLPLTDGKTPLFMWSMMPLLKIFPDPLFAGRFLSILAGFVTMLGVFSLGWRVFNLKSGLWSALIYAIVPFTVFFDRMALVDSMLSAFTIWSIFFAIFLVQSLRLDVAMILGYFLGAGLLTKTPGMINILLLPLAFLGFNFKNRSNLKLLKLLVLLVVSVGIALGMYNILRLGPQFQMLSSRNADYIFSPVELIGRPLDPFVPHFKDIMDWFPQLLTWPILFFGFFGFLVIAKTRKRLGWVIFLWAAVSLLVQTALLKTFTARYLLFSIPPLLILAGFGVNEIYNKLQIKEKFRIILLLFVLVPLPLYFNYLLLSSPANVPLPKEERKGYFEDWTAGYGFLEIANFVKEQAKKGPLIVGTEGYFGTLPEGLQIYLDKAGIPVVGGQATISANLREAAKANQVFFVANNNRMGDSLKGVVKIKEYPKAKPRDGEKEDSIVVYRVFPQ